MLSRTGRDRWLMASSFRQPNGSLTQPRRGPVGQRQSGAPLAATNVKTAGSVCKRRDAARLGRKEGLQPRASERPAVGCSEKLARRMYRGFKCVALGAERWRLGRGMQTRPGELDVADRKSNIPGQQMSHW